jgi:hypothetical protein
MSEKNQPVVLEGTFTIKAHPLSEEGPVSIELTAGAFVANARGLGFALGTVVAWYLDGVQKAGEPETPLSRLLIMAEIHRGMAHAMEAGEIVPAVRQ